jgi:uncharacterized protein (UPF0276 family)
VGLGFRPEIAVELMRAPGVVDFVEIVAESCFVSRDARRQAGAIREIWPVLPHGVKLSLGSADGIEVDRARRLGELARELRAPMVSEHVAFTRAGGTEIGHLTQLPRTREAIAVVARNVERARRVLPDVPLVLENVAWSVRWPGDEMDEPTFYQEVVRATGCELLLDVANLYANAVNEARDPLAALLAFPLDRVALVHVAGGAWRDAFYFDTHAHAVSAEIVALVGTVRARRPDVPIMIERDAHIAFDQLVRELAAIRAAQASAAVAPEARVERVSSRAGDLAGDQAALARELAGYTTIGSAPITRAMGSELLARAGTILTRKRIDEALPRLPALARARE